MSRTSGGPGKAAPRIRRACEPDLAALSNLESTGFGAGAWSRRLLAAELEAATSLVLVAEAGDGRSRDAVRDAAPTELLAYACFRRTAGEAELLRVASAPTARRCGIATALIRAGLDRLSGEGIRACFLEVAETNAAALGLYRELGFREVGRRRGYYERQTDALLLRLNLDRPSV